MGHLVGKDAYRGVARKLDSLTARTPDNGTLRALLEDLYTPEEAELVSRMPNSLCTLAKIQKVTRLPAVGLERRLEALCAKGLVIDLYFERENTTLYQVSPFVIGVFEFTMMRAAADQDHARRARLFREYWDTFCEANLGAGQQGIARVLPHEPHLPDGDHVEILDYERASQVVEQHARFSVGVCSCRHEKHHLGERGCDSSLEMCTALGRSADYLIRRRLAREISRTEMLERIERSRELGLVLAADNVQDGVGFICHCCSCCCNILGSITRHGYPNAIVSSSFEGRIDAATCTGCGRCARACPVDAIELSTTGAAAPAAPRARMHPDQCIGCGVCVGQCRNGSLTLGERERRVFHPANTFERVILQALQAGTLQNFIFDNPNSQTEGFLRGILGGFLRLDVVQRALVSDRLRSTFLRQMTAAATRRSTHGVSPASY